ncbi:hypothetical protein FBFR_10905 [Flavobacterium fryxellicola]|uniref:Uncharacterized protein n=1 Tax=Flavobacterium fryxellicola TaxID=249352 RepID=A0A167WRL3_9FLAO|nr:hypothetical protein [Flavobacterium fryxellicola]OAB27674.1 hypothetical protein FBFR_10905 [Flavobacterium fryxellicola]
MEKTPFSNIRKNIISISNLLVDSFLIKNLISEFFVPEIVNPVFSPDRSKKPGDKKTIFSCQKRATKGSSF